MSTATVRKPKPQVAKLVEHVVAKATSRARDTESLDALLESVLTKRTPRLVHREGKPVAAIMTMREYTILKRIMFMVELASDSAAAQIALNELALEMQQTGKTWEEVTISHEELKRRLGL